MDHVKDKEDDQYLQFVLSGFEFSNFVDMMRGKVKEQQVADREMEDMGF